MKLADAFKYNSLLFRCSRYRPWCESVVLADGTDFIFLGGGDPETCTDGVEGLEEYDVAQNKWKIANRHSAIVATGPSVKVLLIGTCYKIFWD